MRARRHLLHFFALGAALFALKQVDPGVHEPIVVTPGQVDAWRAEWQAETGRAPSAAELQASIRHHADEEILFREALRLGLDRSDPVVRSRLVQNLRFVHDAPQADESAMFAEALALGMNRSDLVVRRRLIDAMEARLGAGAEVSSADTQQYVAQHPERYAGAERISFAQVFFDAGRHPRDLDDAAARAAARLEAGEHVTSEAFLHGERFEAQSQPDLARRFGGDFARAALAAPAGQWVGPLRSPYGLHFIRVDARTTAPTDAQAVQREAYYALLEERERAHVRSKLERLRDAYPLHVESTVVARAQP